MMSAARSFGMALWALVGVAVVGCSGDAVDAVKNTITCKDVCQRYSDCFDADYDVDGCVDRCENKATPDEEKEAQLEKCDACIDDKSCASAVFGCTTDCASFVP
jgi:hypothetical protein